MTQEDLADKTEVSFRTIQRFENGEVDPRAYTLQMIAKALDVDFSLFVEDKSRESSDSLNVNNSNWSGFLHLSGLLPLIFPTIIMWTYKKEKTEDISKHFRAAITMQLCILVISFIGLWIYWKTNQPIPFLGGLLVGGLVSIFNALNVMNGRSYTIPFIKRIEIK